MKKNQPQQANPEELQKQLLSISKLTPVMHNDEPEARGSRPTDKLFTT